MGHPEEFVRERQHGHNLVTLASVHELELDEGGDVHDPITKVKVIRDQFAMIGHRVDSAQLALIVLHRLLRSYHRFVTTVMVGERTRPLIFDELAPLLLHEEAWENLITIQMRKP